jgi:ankyrin repeat protein
MTLVRAIVARNRSQVAQLIDTSPQLATAQADMGATRQTSTPFYFDEIQHYLYKGDTAVHMAAAAHEPDFVHLLVARGADVGVGNRRGAQPLHYAADGIPGSPCWNPVGQAEVITLLIASGADPNASDKSGVRPLHRAVRTRCAQAVRALLEGGAEPGLANGNGSTPLQLATSMTGRGGSGSAEAKEQQEAIVELLTTRVTTT